MTKFLVLYRSGAAEGERAPKAARDLADARINSWAVWEEQAGEAIVEPGAPVEGFTRIGWLRTASDPGTITGFSVMQAESSSALAGLLTEHPHLDAPGTWVEVFKILPAKGAQRSLRPRFSSRLREARVAPPELARGADRLQS